MRRISYLIFFLTALFMFPQQGFAAGDGTSIILDGRSLDLPTNGQVQNVQGNVLIPIRVVAEELGFNVKWEKKTRTVTIQQSDTVLLLVVNEQTATVNSSKVKLSAPPKLEGDTTLVPLRFVSEQMGMSVSWDNKSKTVYLKSPDQGSGSGKGDTADSGQGGDLQVPVKNPAAETLASVSGISFSDNRLMIAVDEKVTPNVFTIKGPDRIVIDLPNTKFGDTFQEGLPLDSKQSGYFDVTDYPDLSKVRYALFSTEPSTIRIVMDLNYVKNYELINLNDGLIIVDLNAAPQTPALPGNDGKMLVVIDAGHGGSDPGAISVTKKREKDFNLAVALKVEKLLKNETDIEFVLTRSSDTYPKLEDRVKIANDLNADLFVSIHANAGPSSVSGVETYYTRKESLEFAKVMHKYLVDASGLTDRKVRSKSLHVTRETKMPAILLECGYLSNKKDDALLFSDSFQNRVAEGIVKGIKEYLSVQ